MDADLTKPGWLVLVLFVLWGIAGKLDEPPEGFDPEPTASAITVASEEAVFPPIHLLCYLDEGRGGHTSPKSGVAVLTSFQPSQHASPGRVTGQSRLLQCVVSDD
ncbi:MULTISPECIES: hypothetical protein [Piscinibacter]|uniref:hypothetical protein n=1 Tax=Piscinibacter TaxID=1114981 RepID=UPI000FDD5A52|nr:hypothetical protein [Piscinibacter defluvii]